MAVMAFATLVNGAEAMHAYRMALSSSRKPHPSRDSFACAAVV